MAHRRIQSGGDPAQGPPRDVVESVPLGNEPGSFPDVPPQNRADIPPGQPPAGGRRVDLDAFAERLGLRHRADDDRRDEPDGGSGVIGRLQGTVGTALHGVARLMGVTSRTLDRLAKRIDQR